MVSFGAKAYRIRVDGKVDLRTVRNFRNLPWYGHIDNTRKDEMISLGYSSSRIAKELGTDRRNVHDYVKRKGEEFLLDWYDRRNFRIILERIADSYNNSRTG
ncbi:MAG: hypothetical protein AABW73_01725 [Nanoarchaeota archaeon]